MVYIGIRWALRMFILFILFLYPLPSSVWNLMFPAYKLLASVVLRAWAMTLNDPSLLSIPATYFLCDFG